AIFVEYTGIEQFEFRLAFVALPIFLYKFRVRKFRLGVFIEILHVRMRRRAVEIEIVFLRVLAMVAFVSSEAENPFFQNWITFVPQCEGKANHLPAVTDPSQAVFVPAIGAR